MKNLRCPAYITALIHFHCYPEPLFDSPVNHEATQAFLRAGLIEPCDEVPKGFRTTARGAAYVSALCLVPPPAPTFRDAAGNTFDLTGTHITNETP